jgi:hypothetical protein
MTGEKREASFDEREFETSDAVATLEDRRESVASALEETIEQFSDEGVSDVLLRAHDELP